MKTLLNEGKFEGKHILSAGTVKLMSENQMGALRVPQMRSTDYFLSADADFLPGIEKSWGLSFLINEENNPGESYLQKFISLVKFNHSKSRSETNFSAIWQMSSTIGHGGRGKNAD